MPEPLPLVTPTVPGAVAPGTVTVDTTSTTQTVSPIAPQNWLSRHLQNFLLLALGGSIIYLAVIGEEQARQTIYSVFLTLAGVKFGAQTALKRPGQDS